MFFLFFCFVLKIMVLNFSIGKQILKVYIKQMGFIYIARLPEFINSGSYVYKLGRTERPILQKFNSYPKGSTLEYFVQASNTRLVESNIIYLLKEHENIRQCVEYGTEFFEGDIEYIKYIIQESIQHSNHSITEDRQFYLEFARECITRDENYSVSINNLFNVFKEWYLEKHPYQKIPSFQAFNLTIGEILGKQTDNMFWRGVRLKRFHIFGDCHPKTEETSYSRTDCDHNIIHNNNNRENKTNYHYEDSSVQNRHIPPHCRVNVRIDHLNPQKRSNKGNNEDGFGFNDMNLPQSSHHQESSKKPSSYADDEFVQPSQSSYTEAVHHQPYYENPFDVYQVENEEKNKNVVNPFDEFEPQLEPEQNQGYNPFDDIIVGNQCIKKSHDMDADDNYCSTTIKRFVDDDYYSTIIDIVSGISTSTQKRTGMNIWGDLKDMMSQAKTQKKKPIPQSISTLD